MTETQTSTGRRGMRDLRTSVTARVRSKPVVEGQRYLDLYVLQRDRSRWKRLKDQAEKSMDSIDQALMKLGFSADGEEQDRLSPAPNHIAGTGGAPAKVRRAAPPRNRRA
jgi:hypothetical protein